MNNHGVPLIPDTAPFSPEQRAWLNGFFAGLFSCGPGTSAAPSSTLNPPLATAQSLTPLTILFGSQTGTAEVLAKRAAREAGKCGFAATVLDMAQTDATKLAAERNLLVITSTYGEGEPPDNAKALHSALTSAVCHPLEDKPASMNSLRFSVCALGDTNYVQFCKCGADFDVLLEKLGGTRILARADCDLDYEEKYSAWLSAALGSFRAQAGAVARREDVPESRDKPTPAASDPSPAARPSNAKSRPEIAPGLSRSNPFSALLLTSRNLNAAGSAKQVYHIEFDLTGSALAYEAGDALGVFPHNCPALVGDILSALGCDGEEAVPAPDGSTTSLRHALIEHYDLGRPSTDLLAHYAPGSGGGTALALHHVVDVIMARADVRLPPVDFVRALRKLQPRLYSISSSPRAHAGQVHLTVGAVRYDLHGRTRTGVCSTFLAERVVSRESRVRVFVHSNQAFRPPAESETPMIMVGPGTGIAPFRAFLHERSVTGAHGRNWLFFGDQRATTDFLYRDELGVLMRDGVLSRLDTAFSRDQPQKIYVQQRMLEHAAELYGWLEAGAHFYVCGDASRMAKDVDAALHLVVERAGGKTHEQAALYVQTLRTEKRYRRDVY